MLWASADGGLVRVSRPRPRNTYTAPRGNKCNDDSFLSGWPLRQPHLSTIIGGLGKLTSSLRTFLKSFCVSILTGPLAGYIPAATHVASTDNAVKKVFVSMMVGGSDSKGEMSVQKDISKLTERACCDTYTYNVKHFPNVSALIILPIPRSVIPPICNIRSSRRGGKLHSPMSFALTPCKLPDHCRTVNFLITATLSPFKHPPEADFVQTYYQQYVSGEYRTVESSVEIASSERLHACTKYPSLILGLAFKANGVRFVAEIGAGP